MERFQRSKYQNGLAGIRRELAQWAATYRTMLLPERAFQHTPQELKTADDRLYWIEDIVWQLECLEESFDTPRARGGPR